MNTPVSSCDEVTSLCRCSSVSEVRKMYVYVNGGKDAAWCVSTKISSITEERLSRNRRIRAVCWSFFFRSIQYV